MKSFFKLREELDSCCDECADDTLYGSVEEDFEPTGEEQYEDWDEINEGGPGLWANIHAKRQRIKAGSGERMREPGSKGAPTSSALKRAAESYEDLDEAKDTDKYTYIDQSKGPVIKGKSGTYVGYTHSAFKGKGANILKHNTTKKYYAAGGSSTAFTHKTTLHDTPEDAARAYHKGNLAEASPMIKPPKNEFGKKEDAHDFKLLRKEDAEQVDEAESHQAKTTMKHVKNATAGEKKAAKDIKPGVAGYRDRIAMLKSAEARGGLKKEEVEQVKEGYGEDDIAVGGTAIYKHDGKHHMSKVSHKTGGGASTKIHTKSGHVVPLHHVVSTDASDWNHFKDKAVKEEVEQVDELNKKTLASYVSKAAGSYGRDKQLIGRTSPDGTVKSADPDLKRAVKNRLTGINRAAERLAKEEASPMIKAPTNEFGNPVVSGSLETIGDRKYVREQGVAEASWTAAASMHAATRKRDPQSQDPKHNFRVGDVVTTKDGKSGKVVFVGGEKIQVKGTNSYYPDRVTHHTASELKKGVAESLELQEAEKGGRKVQLNKPFRTSDGKGKFAVYTKNEKGNVVKVNFGDTTGLTIKTSNPDRRRNFRARHNCDNPGPRHKARFWSCKSWSRGTVSAGLGT